MSHSPSTSHQSQPSSPKPARLVQDLPGTPWPRKPLTRAGGVSNTKHHSTPAMTLGALASPTDELVQAGWEKCWSKRENRPYYFNRFTNQSLWEMPLLGQHDVIVSGLAWLLRARPPGASLGCSHSSLGRDGRPQGGANGSLFGPPSRTPWV